MAKDIFLVTNNGKVLEVYGDHAKIGVEYLEGGSCLDVLIRVRDLVHAGRRLMSHPQASSLKPNQSPCKTVLLLDGRGAQSFARDVEMAESSIAALHKFAGDMPPPNWPERVLRDFQTIDLSVIESAVERVLMLQPITEHKHSQGGVPN